jgi:cell division transport system permease protein
MNDIPEQVRLRLPGGFHLPPFGIHQFLAAVIVCVALWTVGMLWLGLQGANQWVGSWKNDIRVHVYLNADNSQQAEQLQRDLTDIEGVTEVTQISREEAARWMNEWMGDIGLGTHELRDRLPLTFQLSVQPEGHDFLFGDIRDAAHRNMAEVNESEISLAQAHRWLDQLQTLAMFASLVLVLAMMLIISNTLRMTLLARADEIHLMRLLGAREWFVRMPFILEGVAMGAGAGVAAWLLLWPVLWLGSEWLHNMGVNMHLLVLLLPMLFGGAVVGCLGAAIATTRVVSSENPE